MLHMDSRSIVYNIVQITTLRGFHNSACAHHVNQKLDAYHISIIERMHITWKIAGHYQ